MVFLPMAHWVQAADPLPALYAPCAHAEHWATPCGPVEPGWHPHTASEVHTLPSTQASQRSAASVELCVQAGHGVHTFGVADVAYFPGVHAVQAPRPGAPVYPRLHVQVSDDVAPNSSWNLPGGQRSHHQANPTYSLYSPHPHCLQLLSPRYPATHTQSCSLSLPSGEY